MQFYEAADPHRILIQSYEPGQITIRHQTYTQSLYVGFDWIDESLGLSHLDEFNDAHFQTIMQHSPEVLIIGSGDSHVWLAPQWQLAFAQAGVGVEIMRNQSAVHTYNVLTTDERRIGLVLCL